MKARILVVEDERAIQIALSGLLGRAGYDVHVSGTGDDAIQRLEAGSHFDLVLTDLALGRGATGMDVLRRVKALRPETVVVMITAHGSETIAVDAMKAGAEDYVPKPFDNDEIRLVVQRALERTRLARENRLLLDRVKREYGFENLIGSGRAMQRVFETIQKVAETDLTVLVRGESGTGKELVAQALHNRSNRANRPFVAVNCAAISRELVESELFGHEKGAFTGADKPSAKGASRPPTAAPSSSTRSETCPPETQAKLLRVLQERREFSSASGETRPIQVDVRVRRRDQPRPRGPRCAHGRFREDLLYRLNVVRMVGHAAPARAASRTSCPLAGGTFVDQVCGNFGLKTRQEAGPCEFSKEAPEATLARATTGPATCASCAT